MDSGVADESLLALGGLGAAAGGVGAGAAVGLDVSAGSLVLHSESAPWLHCIE